MSSPRTGILSSWFGYLIDQSEAIIVHVYCVAPWQSFRSLHFRCQERHHHRRSPGATRWVSCRSKLIPFNFAIDTLKTICIPATTADIFFQKWILYHGIFKMNFNSGSERCSIWILNLDEEQIEKFQEVQYNLKCWSIPPRRSEGQCCQVNIIIFQFFNLLIWKYYRYSTIGRNSRGYQNMIRGEADFNASGNFEPKSLNLSQENNYLYY